MIYRSMRGAEERRTRRVNRAEANARQKVLKRNGWRIDEEIIGEE